MPTVIKKLDANSYQLKDQVVSINRVTKVVKGGKNLSFAALVVVGTGMILSNPVVRRYMSQMGFGDVLGNIIPDVERYFKLRSM